MTFMHLHFNTTYTFTVQSVTVKGDGEPVHIKATTGPFTAPVHGLKKVLINNHLTLTWKNPEQIDIKKALKVR